MTSVAPYICCCNTTTITPVEVQICHTCNLCWSFVIDWSYRDETYLWPDIAPCLDGYYVQCDPDGIPDNGDEYETLVYNLRPSCEVVSATTCDCSCSVVVTPQSWCTNGSCGVPPEVRGEASGSTLQSLCWTLPYVSTADETTSGIWSFNDAGNVFLTGYTAFIERKVETYSGSIQFAKLTSTSPAGVCADCFIGEHDPTNTGSPTVEFRYGGKYTADVPAMVIGGATAAYAAWTCEITATDCIIRDGGGVTQYTFALATHTMEQLRVALDGKAELVSVRLGPSFSSATFRGVSSTYLPIQGPFAIGHYGAGTWDTINIRHVGDAVEDWQIRLASSSYTIKNTTGVVQGRVFFQQFSANYGLWEQGFQLKYDTSTNPCLMAEECCDCLYNIGLTEPASSTTSSGCTLSPGGDICSFGLCPDGNAFGFDLVCGVVSPYWSGGTTSSGWQDSSFTDPVSESLTEWNEYGSWYRIETKYCWTGFVCNTPQTGDKSKCYIGSQTCDKIKQEGFWLKRIVSVT